MLFGHNTNLTVGATTYHVQTEDRGVANALIDTTVYYQGRVLHRRTNNYFDLLPLDSDSEQALKLRLDEQHHGVLEAIRSGRLQLPVPPAQPAARTGASAPPPKPAASAPLPATPQALRALTLELLNPKSWLSGKHANLQIAVRGEQGEAVGRAIVVLQVEGAAEPAEFSAETTLTGQVQLEFDLPRITGAEPALVVSAKHGRAKGQLRFALRAKPRVPSA
jgi:hypothetical protein